MSCYENLSFGQHVIFHDERQLEVAGTVKEREEFEEHICYLIELDNGGFYNAELYKMPETCLRSPVER